jgi:hypothetical protein
MENNHIPHVLRGLKDLCCFYIKIVKIRHVIYVAIIWLLFFSNADQSEPFEYSHIFKKFILICISKKNKSLTIATCITCLIYMISMHFSH